MTTLGFPPPSVAFFQRSPCAVWSELDSVVYTEPLSYLVDHCVVYILWRRGSAGVLSLGRVWTQDSLDR